MKVLLNIFPEYIEKTINKNRLILSRKLFLRSISMYLESINANHGTLDKLEEDENYTFMRIYLMEHAAIATGISIEPSCIFKDDNNFGKKPSYIFKIDKDSNRIIRILKSTEHMDYRSDLICCEVPLRKGMLYIELVNEAYDLFFKYLERNNIEYEVTD